MSDSQGPFLGAELSDYRRERYIWYMWEKYIRPVKWVAFGVGIGVGCTLLAGRQQSDSLVRSATYWKRGENFYQGMGFVWDEETKDFKVLYRPLFHCKGQLGSHEAHLIACAPMHSFDEILPYAAIDHDAKALAIPGPFAHDPEWNLPTTINALPGSKPAVIASTASSTSLSGYGTASHNQYKAKFG